MKKRVFDEAILNNSHFRSLSHEAKLLYLLATPDSMGLISDMTITLDALSLDKSFVAELVNGKFLIDLGEGLYLQKHWHINNRLDPNRLSSTYVERLKNVYVKKNMAYTLNKDEGNRRLTRLYIAQYLTDDIMANGDDKTIAEVQDIVKRNWVDTD